MSAARPVGNTRSIPVSILLAVITFWIYTLFWTYWTFDELERYRGRGLGGAVGLIVYILCLIVGWVAIAITGILIWTEIQALYREDGREAPHSPLWGLWLLLPFVGNFIWFIPTQQALNDFWESKLGSRAI